MKRPVVIVLAGLLAVAVIFAASFALSRQWCVRHVVRTDDLAWLQQEFGLNDAELARVRQLHEGYLPACAEMCRRIAAKKRELESALAGQTQLTAAAEKNLAELGALRAQCQAAMLRHFAEVSQAMPPAQGRRYLAEMQRLTLGFHEQIEQSMAKDGHAHGQH
jgi:hypothetical protein